MGLILALITAIFFGISNILARRGLEKHNINSFMGVLLTLTAVNLFNIPVLIIYLLFFTIPEYNWAGIIFFLLAGFLNTFLGRKLLFSSIESIGPSRAGAFKIISPLIVVIIGVGVLGERLTTAAWIGVLTILLGIFLVSQETRNKAANLTTSNYLNHNKAASNDLYFKRGVGFGLLSGIAFGTGNIFRKAGINIFPSFIMAVFISSLFALVCTWIYMIIKGHGGEAVSNLKKYWHGPFLWTGFFTSMALYSLFSALRMAPVSIVNSVSASEPLFTMLVSVIFLGRTERLRLNTLLRALVIVAGLIILFTFNR